MKPVKALVSVESAHIALVKAQVERAYKAAFEIKVVSTKSLEEAVGVLGKVAQVGKLIKVQKDKIVVPANEVLRNARALFAPLEARWAEADSTLRNKMLFFRQGVEKARLAEEAKLQKRVEAGQLKPETALEKSASLPSVEKTIRSSEATVSFPKLRKVEITDASKLPREYLVPNLVLIRQDVLR